MLPEDMNAWIQSQLQVASPALGLASSYADVAQWPDHLQPDLSRRAFDVAPAIVILEKPVA